ncbi:glycosyl hydrolase [Sphingopyxis witflariensis]|uniref:Lysozyme n=2 Tax=Sphingopyxis witflariensis TaxID=173675 RepID=A0A246JYB8_9SPHN|nr:glycosyl hydrolase [Sphingopyxis witflariensis]
MKAIAVIGAGALALTAPFVAQWEGKRNDPYRDIVGVWTVCYGDTRDVKPGQRQTDAQCQDRLYAQIADHAKPVVACVPQLKGKDAQLAASVSLAYNIGTGGFCKSTAAKRFRAGDWKGGCNAFYAWRFAGGKEIRGLANRRRQEMALCRTGL